MGRSSASSHRRRRRDLPRDDQISARVVVVMQSPLIDDAMVAGSGWVDYGLGWAFPAGAVGWGGMEAVSQCPHGQAQAARFFQ